MPTRLPNLVTQRPIAGFIVVILRPRITDGPVDHVGKRDVKLVRSALFDRSHPLLKRLVVNDIVAEKEPGHLGLPVLVHAGFEKLGSRVPGQCVLQPLLVRFRNLYMCFWPLLEVVVFVDRHHDGFTDRFVVLGAQGEEGVEGPLLDVRLDAVVEFVVLECGVGIYSVPVDGDEVHVLLDDWVKGQLEVLGTVVWDALWFGRSDAAEHGSSVAAGLDSWCQMPRASLVAGEQGVEDGEGSTHGGGFGIVILEVS